LKTNLNNNRRQIVRGLLGFAVLIIVIFGYQNCSKSQNTTASSGAGTGAGSTNGKSGIFVSWTANRETAVNRAGGGYKVYYGTQSGFSLSGASFVNVPYASGTLSPTSVLLPITASGTYYIVIVAYSSLGSSGSMSSPSAQTSISIP
jgi:hypothetical protein